VINPTREFDGGGGIGDGGIGWGDGWGDGIGAINGSGGGGGIGWGDGWGGKPPPEVGECD
jgi:hypothetical protein